MILLRAVKGGRGQRGIYPRGQWMKSYPLCSATFSVPLLSRRLYLYTHVAVGRARLVREEIASVVRIFGLSLESYPTGTNPSKTTLGD